MNPWLIGAGLLWLSKQGKQKPARVNANAAKAPPERAPEVQAARAAIDALPAPLREPARDAARTPALTPKQTAIALRLYLNKTHKFGDKTHRDDVVAQAERDLGLVATGVVGPLLRNKARSLGVVLPLRGSR